MSALTVLARIRILEVLRRPTSAFWFFVLPLVFVFLVSVVFAKGHPFERRRVAIVGDVDVAALRPHEATGGLKIEPAATEAVARLRLRSRAASAVIVAAGERQAHDGPSNAAVPAHVHVIVGDRDVLFGEGIVTELDRGRRGSPTTLETLALPATGYVTYLVPGMLGQAVVIAGLFGMGYAMVRYRESRFLRKLATTPLRRADFVLAQLAARVVLVAIQLALLLAVCTLAFDLPLTLGKLAAILATGAVGLVTFMGIGFVVSCLVTSSDTVVDIINAIAVPIGLLSEIFFPSDELPRALAWVSGTLPSTQMIRIFRAVLLDAEAPSDVFTTGFAILGAWAVISFAIAVRTFRWE